MAPPIFELKGSPSRVRTSALYVSSSGVDALYGVQASWWGQRTKRLLLSSAKISAQDLEETKDGAETGSNEENSGQEADEDEAEPALVEAEDGGAKILPYDFTKVAVAFSKDGTKSKQKYLFFQSAAGDIYEYRISTKTSFKIVATDAPKAKLGTALAAAVSKQSTLLFYQADENDSIVCLSRKDDEAGTWTYTSVSADSAPGTDLSAVQWLNQKNNYVGVAFTSKHAVDQTALGSRAADTGSESAGATDPEAAADTGSEAAADTGSEAAADTGSESAADTGSESAAAIGSESATESSSGACRIDICFANLGEDGAQPLKFELSPVQISAPKLRGAFAVSRVRYPYDTGDIIDKFCVCGQLDEDESSLVSVWTDSEGKKDEEQTNVSKLTDDIGPHRSGKHLVTSIGVAHIPGSRWVQVAYATESGVMFSRLIEYALPRAGIVFEADDLKALIDILNPPDTNVIGKRLLESLQKMYDQLRTTAPREITWHDDKKYKEVDEQVSPVDP